MFLSADALSIACIVKQEFNTVPMIPLQSFNDAQMQWVENYLLKSRNLRPNTIIKDFSYLKAQEKEKKNDDFY